ncbi:hypothetical protein ACJJTC_014213 [Scirpophaga incertulas]
MSEERNVIKNKLTLQIPTIKAESETQTTSHLVSKTPDILNINEMEMEQKQAMSLRKRRNLSKNRGQAARQREKTPEPGRTPMPHEDTTTSDDEEVNKPQRSSREIEAETTYQEMKRLVQERASDKDPEYDIDTDEILEARAVAANERRRRSISPFALPDKEEISQLQRKGSFVDPANKLLSTNYTLSPKDEDKNRRGSLTIETSKEVKKSLSPTSPSTASPIEKGFPYPLPTTPKKLEEIVYDDEKKPDEKILKTPVKKDGNFTFEEKDTKPTPKSTPKTPETPTSQGELVTKVIQVERTPSKKVTADKKPNVEVRDRIVRTPSRKLSADIKPINVKQPSKQVKEETQSKIPPVKPARSKSSSRLGNKTSESEMSEDQGIQMNSNITGSKRKIIPTPRRFTKNRSPRAKRSQSMNRYDESKILDKTGTAMSQTSKEIIELMQKARARSLSIPKDDPRLINEYRINSKNLETPNKTPSTTPRNVRGISCPKTIQIISDKTILSGLKAHQRTELHDKHSRQSSGYIDASQSEYTSSCYSSSPSENEFDFDLSERTAELSRKLKKLSQEVEDNEMASNILFSKINTETYNEPKPVLRKRSLINEKTDASLSNKLSEKRVDKKLIDKDSKTEPPVAQSRWRIVSNWRKFKYEQRVECEKIRLLRNKCACDLILIIILCGLGGMMFKTLEGSYEDNFKCNSRSVKRDFIEALWRGSHYLREEDWKSMARKKLYEFENQLHTTFEAGIASYSGQRSWNFMNSFVYCLTVITTIGYGHITPATEYGRAATIVYAVIGIPLFLIVLADFGKLFTRIIKFFWAYIRRFYYTRSCKKVRRTKPVQDVMKGLNIVYDVVRRPSQIFNEEDIDREDINAPPAIERKPSDVPPPLPPKPGSTLLATNIIIETEPGTPAPSVFEIDDEFNLPISVAIIILVIYIFIGATIYSTWENWSFLESFYFVFISMSTIGLGDIVPCHPMRMMASMLYLVFGLALTSMCINVVQVKLSDTFKQASAKLGATIGLNVDEDGSPLPLALPTEIVPVHKPKTDIEKSKDVEITQERDEIDAVTHC